MRDQLVARDLVAAALWPESAEERANASLRSAISRLDDRARQAVKVTAHGLSLAGGVTVDLHHSQALATD